MTDCLAVTLDDITMDGSADGDGIVWAWRELPGWWEGGTPQTDIYGRLAANGDAHGEAWQRGRHITIAGTASVPVTETDPVAKLLIARRKVREAVAWDADVELTVDEGATLGVLRAAVHQALQLRFGRQRTVYELEFEVPVAADDWRKTSETIIQQVVGAGGVVANAGNAAATPSLRISGDSGANVGVTNATTGETISTDLDLAGGDVLVIDVDAMTATLNGVDASDNLLLGSQFFDLIVGNNTVNLVNAGTASLRVDYRTSWK